MTALIKPQFEAGRENVGKKGVVRDPAVHREVLEQFLSHAGDSGFTVLGLTYSPIRGPEGNIEYLAYLEKGAWVPMSFEGHPGRGENSPGAGFSDRGLFPL